MADAVVQLVQSRAVVTVGGGELVALKAAQAAEPFAVRSETALAQILDLASGSPTAPSILNKLDKFANLSDLTDFVAARANLGVRYVGGRTFYVRKDGSDSNDGLANTAGRAFLTIQRAVNAAYGIDARGSVIQIRVGDGTYAESVRVFGSLVGAFDDTNQPLRIVGNEANPQNVVINPVGADAVRVGDHATVLFYGFTFGTTTSGHGIYATNHAFIQHRNCRFADVAGEMILAARAFVQAVGNTTIVGNAVSFIHATNNSIVTFSGRTLTYEGTRTFSTYLYGLNTSVLDLSSTTIVGKASGGITVHVNSILNVSSCVGIWTGVQPMFVANGGLISAEDKVAARQFYVRADASSVNNSGFGNTVDEAFPSIQAAINRLAQMPYDLLGSEPAVDASYDWQINVAGGTFSGDSVVLLDTRFPRVTIRGAGQSTTFARDYTSRSRKTVWTIDNQRVGGAGLVALSAMDGAKIIFKALTFVASSFFGFADSGGIVSSSGPFTIAGGSTGSFYAKRGGLITIDASVITLTGTNALGTFALVQTGGLMSAVGTTFTGSGFGVATGTRYNVTSNGVIDTNGQATTFFPGSVAGTTATGGQYV